jgi:NAD(P)H-hydrate epimerase
LIIDGLFGIGLNRPLSADWIELVDEINRSRIPVLSIDTPSGLNADTGEVEGAAVRATVTLTLGAPKQGLLAAAAWPYVGRLEVAPDIGLIPNPPHGRTYWTRGEDFACFPPGRSAAGHKGTFGHLAIFAGSCGYHGAAVLAGKGALRARPGLVTLFTLERVYLPVAAQLQAAMVHPWMPVPSLPPTCSAVLFGPGLAAPDLPADLRSALAQLWQDSPVPVIADATGLEWLPPGPVRAGELRIMTPHPGEAARLLQTSTSAVQQDRPKAVLELSRRFGDCWVVLKGHQTILGRTGSELFVNSSGNPGLAQGGSGDVLAGFLGGLIAQPQLQADPLTTLRYGVWQHGAAADTLEAKRRNWTIEDLLADLGNVGARD